MIYQIQADNNEVNNVNLQKWLGLFKTLIQPNRIKLGQYYDGTNKIVKQGAVEGRPNYSVNVNLAKYITDVVTGYTFGKDVTYSTDNENQQTLLEKIEYINKVVKSNEVDFNVGGDLSCYGIGYQMVIVKEGSEPLENRIVLKRLKPETTFYVVDNTILNEPLYGIYFYDYRQNNQLKTKVYVYDKEYLYLFDGFQDNVMLKSVEPHNMGYIPIIQCLNNDDAFGDYQQITDLLDSLSLTMSNFSDDMQSIANAFLGIHGAILNEGGVEEINKTKVMNMPVGSSAEWVVKNINTEGEKLQIDNLLKFIFQISQVPDLTDDSFGGTQTGVAMRYKLWGIDQLWTTKVKKYTLAIYQRLKIFLHLLQYQIESSVQLEQDIILTFYKNLPLDNSETYQMVQALKGTVSEKTLLTNIPIVKDVQAEIEQIDEEREKEADTYKFDNAEDNINDI